MPVLHDQRQGSSSPRRAFVFRAPSQQHSSAALGSVQLVPGTAYFSTGYFSGSYVHPMLPPPDDPLAIATWLMSTDSTSGREQALTAAFADELVGRGWDVTRIPVSDGRIDVLATSGPAPFVTLSTHLDTVPPYIPMRRDATRLYGRGSCDAKGIAAALLCAA